MAYSDLERRSKPPIDGSAWKRTSVWIGGFVLAVLCLVVLIISPAPLYYWSYKGFRDLFHASAGWPGAWSSVAAILGALFYSLAIPYALGWLVLGKRTTTALVCTVLVLGISPVVHALFDANFNQETGVAQKWYVWSPGGQIGLFDTGGTDPSTGTKKQLLTPEIARILDRAKKGIAPKQITSDPRQLAFFDTGSGQARVWYYKTSQGDFELFDSEGFHPGTGTLLQPVTNEVAEAVRNRASERENRTKLEARLVAEQAEREVKAAADRAKQEAITAAAQAEKEKRELARKQLAELFGTDSYKGGIVLVGARAKRKGDDIAAQAAAQFQTSLSDALRNKGQSLDTVKSGVYNSSHFDALMDGNNASLRESGLFNKIKAVLVAQAETSCRAATSVAGVMSCDVSIGVRIFRSSDGSAVKRDFNETGAGSTPTEAIAQAVHRIAIKFPELLGSI